MYGFQILRGYILNHAHVAAGTCRIWCEAMPQVDQRIGHYGDRGVLSHAQRWDD